MDNDQLNTPVRKPRRLLQISLGTLLCLVTIVALVISHTIYVIKYQKLKRDFETIKKDFAILEVSDPQRIHAVALPTTEPDTYRYKVFLPSNKTYGAYFITESIPATGFPAQGPSMAYGPIREGNNMIEVVLRIEGERFFFSFAGQSTTQKMPRMGTKTVRGSETDGVARGEVAVQEPGKPLLLLRRRDKLSDSKTWISVGSDDPDLGEQGALIWIQESP